MCFFHRSVALTLALCTGLPTLVNTWAEISSYVPDSVKKTVAENLPSNVRASTQVKAKDTVIATAFERLQFDDGESRLCLILSYDNGFQIWDLHDRHSAREILSRREGPIRVVRPLPTPRAAETEGDPLFDKRPVAAVASAASPGDSSDFPAHMIKLFSIPRNKYINMVRFNSPVLDIVANRRIMLVALPRQLYVFDAVTVTRVASLNTFPVPRPPHAVLALGERWLCFPSDAPVRRREIEEETLTDTVVSAASQTAKTVGGALVSAGSALWSYLGSSGAVGESNSEAIRRLLDTYEVNGAADYDATLAADAEAKRTAEELASAGTVMIQDLVTQRTLCHFRAHYQPLSAMAFDASGTLLVVAATDGREFNVYQLRPIDSSSSAGGMGEREKSSASSSAPSSSNGVEALRPRHIYKLVRGFTSAIIQSIRFSRDSRYMCVSSARGTTHVYAISRRGGPVSVVSHAPNRLGPRRLAPTGNALPMAFPGAEDSPLITLSVVNRIKNFTHLERPDTGELHEIPVIASTCRFTLPDEQTDLPLSASNLGTARNAKASRDFDESEIGEDENGSDQTLLLVTQLGVMARYRLHPHPPEPVIEGGDPHELQLDCELESEWDLCRHTSWSAITFNADDEAEFSAVRPGRNPELMSSAEQHVSGNAWLSNVEIETHTPLLRPLWTGPQFRFHAFQQPKTVLLKKKKKNRDKVASPERPVAAQSREKVAVIETSSPFPFDEHTPTTRVEARSAEAFSSPRRGAANSGESSGALFRSMESGGSGPLAVVHALDREASSHSAPTLLSASDAEVLDHGILTNHVLRDAQKPTAPSLVSSSGESQPLRRSLSEAIAHALRTPLPNTAEALRGNAAAQSSAPLINLEESVDVSAALSNTAPSSSSSSARSPVKASWKDVVAKPVNKEDPLGDFENFVASREVASKAVEAASSAKVSVEEASGEKDLPLDEDDGDLYHSFVDDEPKELWQSTNNKGRRKKKNQPK